VGEWQCRWHWARSARELNTGVDAIDRRGALADSANSLASLDSPYSPKLQNMNTADILGDMYFDLRGVSEPLECAVPNPRTSHDCDNPEVIDPNLVIAEVVLEVDTRYGGYGATQCCVRCCGWLPCMWGHGRGWEAMRLAALVAAFAADALSHTSSSPLPIPTASCCVHQGAATCAKMGRTTTATIPAPAACTGVCAGTLLTVRSAMPPWAGRTSVIGWEDALATHVSMPLAVPLSIMCPTRIC